MIDLSEIITRIIKYLIMGIVVGLVCYIIPKEKLTIEELLIIVLSSSITFGIIETFLPSKMTNNKNI